METLEDIENLQKDLKQFKEDFGRQLDAIGSDNGGFHSQMLNLAGKYSEHKELIEFIVFVNDRIELNHMQFKDLMVDTIEEFYQYKLGMLKAMKKQRKDYLALKESYSFKGIMKRLTSDYKILLVSVMMVIAVTSFAFFPAETLEFVKGLFGGKK